MARLQFRFKDMAAEIHAAEKVADKFLAPVSAGVLPALSAHLEIIRVLPTGEPQTWSIPEHLPLCTKTSHGEYDRRGGRNVFAQISCVWDIEPLGDHNLASRTHRKFALSGIASTKVRIMEGQAEAPCQELAMWRVEIGDDMSPGCCFHMQVLGQSEDPPFPSSVPVPRFPALFLTPMSVLEFVLGELFQETWRKHAAWDTSSMQSWRVIQRLRLGRLLCWKAEQVKHSVGPPWTALKSAKPPENLFL
jgi:hypothetical protein